MMMVGVICRNIQSRYHHLIWYGNIFWLKSPLCSNTSACFDLESAVFVILIKEHIYNRFYDLYVFNSLINCYIDIY